MLLLAATPDMASVCHAACAVARPHPVLFSVAGSLGSRRWPNGGDRCPPDTSCGRFRAFRNRPYPVTGRPLTTSSTNPSLYLHSAITHKTRHTINNTRRSVVTARMLAAAARGALGAPAALNAGPAVAFRRMFASVDDPITVEVGRGWSSDCGVDCGVWVRPRERAPSGSVPGRHQQHPCGVVQGHRLRGVAKRGRSRSSPWALFDLLHSGTGTIGHASRAMEDAPPATPPLPLTVPQPLASLSPRPQVAPFKLHKITEADAPSNKVTTSLKELLSMYELMYKMRRMEIAADMMYKAKLIRGFCHL